MTEPGDAVRGTAESSQRPKRVKAAIADLALVVRVPNRPAAVLVFTAAEAEDARRYAASMGAEVEPLAGA